MYEITSLKITGGGLLTLKSNFGHEEDYKNKGKI